MEATTRRAFLKSTGYLSIGFTLLGVSCLSKKEASPSQPENVFGPVDEHKIDSWIHIAADGQVTVRTGKMELGQGIKTVIAQVAAEELNRDPKDIHIEVAETGVTPNEGYTVGSQSVATSAMTVRQAAACAREALLQMAALELGEAPETLELQEGAVGNGEKQILLEQLLDGKQIDGNLSEPQSYRAKTVRKVVGHSVPRQDIEDMVRARPHFIQDLRFPAMVHARVIRPNNYTARLEALDEAWAQQLPGLEKLVRIGSFLGVIAQGEFRAIQLMRTIGEKVQWTDQTPLPADQNLNTYLKSLPTDTEQTVRKGNPTSALKKAKWKHRAAYSRPYIMHASNGPACAVALYTEGKLHIWCHSQGIYPLRATLSQLLELAEENIHIKGVPGSGCYGHNPADDAAAEAALMAMEYPNKHVRLQWMREDEHGWEPYGTAMLMELEAGVDAHGKIQGWQYELWSDAHGTRPGREPDSLLPARFLDKGYKRPAVGFRGGATRNAEPCYPFTDVEVNTHYFVGPLRRSALRSLGAHANIFAMECFLDELAEKSGIAPLEFREKQLEDPRALEVLRRLAQKTSALSLGANEGLGHAYTRYDNYGAYCGVSAWVAVDPNTGKVRVKKYWAVVDVGEAINPDGIQNQIEGSMVQACSWTLKEEVTFTQEHISSLNWTTYPILRYPEAPETEVEVIDRPEEPPVGAGEAAQGPASAALANAIYKVTGVRVRELPIQPKLLKTT